MITALWIIGTVFLVIAIGIVALWLWAAFALFRSAGCVPLDLLPEGPRREIEALKLDYQIAEELGYGGDALLGLESKILEAERIAEERYLPAETHVVFAPGPLFVAETICFCPRRFLTYTVMSNTIVYTSYREQRTA